MFGYIYRTKNLVNGKIYIGQKQSSSIIKNYLGSGVALSHAIKKYGKDKFSLAVLFWCCDRKQLDEAEKVMIAMLKDKCILYNIAEGGQGGRGMLGKKQSEETKEKIRIAHIGRHHSKETIEKLKQAKVGYKSNRAGKRLSEETREKLRQANIGKKLSLQTRNKMSLAKRGNKNHFYGRKHTQETKDKIRLTKMNYQDCSRGL